MHKTHIPSRAAATLAFAAYLGCAVADPPATARESVHELMLKDLAAVPDKQLRMLSVEYPPGGASPPHQRRCSYTCSRARCAWRWPVRRRSQ
jgi:hypothetical protein